MPRLPVEGYVADDNNGLPVEQPYSGSNLGPLQPANAQTVVGNTTNVVEPSLIDRIISNIGTAGLPEGKAKDFWNDARPVLGTEENRLWPERLARSGLTAAGDALAGKIPQYEADPITGEMHISPQMIERANDMAALSGVGGFRSTTAAKLLSDTSKPGVALQANKPVFYSAVEHQVNNVPQAKMTGDQWLGTLSNKPGVKPEELDWTGLRGYLEENKGKPITKEAIQSHLAENKIELGEVQKGATENAVKSADTNLQKAIGDSAVVNGSKLYPDEIVSNLYNGELKPKDLPEHLQSLAQTLVDASVNHQAGYNPTKYHSYQLPGGENYREMLMTLPTTQKDILNKATEIAKREGYSSFEALPKNRQSEILDDVNSMQLQGYKSSHWDEPNILAHVRMNDRMIEGKKSLHLEEIQSDWHQQGRDKGYSSGENIQDLVSKEKSALENAWLKVSDNKYKNYSEAMNANESGPSFLEMQKKAGADADVADIRKRINDARDGVPDAPFKKNWHELALKRVMREAAEKGYDRVSWTPGEAQAARYDLSKHYQDIHAKKREDGTFMLQGTQVGQKHPNALADRVTADKLADVVGKELAEKIVKDGGGDYAGADLKVGGEGMKGFYDNIIPKAVEKLGKEHGVKVKQSNITEHEAYVGQGRDGPVTIPKKEQPIHYFDVPQSLKDTVLGKGQALFSAGIPFPLVPVDHDPFKFKPVDHNPFGEQ